MKCISLLCSQRRPNNNDLTKCTAVTTACIYMVISKYYFPMKGKWILGELANSRSERINAQNDSGTPCHIRLWENYYCGHVKNDSGDNVGDRRN